MELQPSKDTRRRRNSRLPKRRIWVGFELVVENLRSTYASHFAALHKIASAVANATRQHRRTQNAVI